MSQESMPPLPKGDNSNAKGCIIGCAAAFLLVMITVAVAIYAVYAVVNGKVNQYTEDQPREIPQLELSEEALRASEDKLLALENAAATGEGPREFRLTGDDLNVMLRNSEGGAIFGDSTFVSVENGEVHGEVSLDLGKIIPFFDGRYANGSATVNVFLEAGRLHVYVKSFRVRGEELPEDMLRNISSQNLADEEQNNPEFQAWVDKLESLNVEGNEIVLKLKDGAAAPVAPEVTTEEVVIEPSTGE